MLPKHTNEKNPMLSIICVGHVNFGDNITSRNFSADVLKKPMSKRNIINKVADLC